MFAEFLFFKKNFFIGVQLIYWVGQKVHLGFSVPSYRTISEFFGQLNTVLCQFQVYNKVNQLYIYQGFPGSSAGKESTYNAGDPSSIPGSGRSPGEGIGYHLQYSWASLVAQMVKNPPACGRPGFDPWVGMIPWMRAWQLTPVFLPGESSWTEKPGRLQSMGSQNVRHN